MKHIKHFCIPDIQARPDIDLSYLRWIGAYIIKKKPDVIVCIGDFADMPSLSSYDRGKIQFEGRRYKKDIAAAKEAMDLLLAPIREYNKRASKNHTTRYKPRMVMTLGNHESRLERVSELQPELHGIISYDDLPYEDWEVIPFLQPIEIDGIHYVHYLANPFTGKPYAGSAANQLSKVKRSFVVGHKQILDVHTEYTLGGKQIWGVIAGASYPHAENYKGPQGNHHWRGCLMLHRVVDGSFDPMLISLDYLKDKYEEENTND